MSKDKSGLRRKKIKSIFKETFGQLYNQIYRTYEINGQTVVSPYPVSGIVGISIVIITILFSIYIKMDLIMFFKNIDEVFKFFGRIAHPDLSYLSQVWGPLLDTINVTSKYPFKERFFRSLIDCASASTATEPSRYIRPKGALSIISGFLPGEILTISPFSISNV